MPQSRSHGGQAANFCVGGKIGKKAGKSGSINLAALGDSWQILGTYFTGAFPM